MHSMMKKKSQPIDIKEKKYYGDHSTDGAWCRWAGRPMAGGAGNRVASWLLAGTPFALLQGVNGGPWTPHPTGSCSE